MAGAAPTLDVDVLGFEELRPGKPRARLVLLITLRDDRRAPRERTIGVDAPLEPSADAGTALAIAMSRALARATREVAERVAVELRRAEGSSSVAAPHGD